MHPYVNILGKAVPIYGLSLIIAAAAAWLILFMLARKKRLDINDLSLVFLIAVCGGFIGAVALRPIMKIVEVAIAWEKYKVVSAGELFHYITGEVVFYGGLLGGMVAVLLYTGKFKMEIVPLFDIFASPLAAAHDIGRTGCLFAGCCYGIEVSQGHPISIVYPPAAIGAPSDVPILAVPLIEAAFLLILSVSLAVIYLKSKRLGLCASIYLLAYSIERFVLEFFRGDLIRGSYGPFTTSQIISIVIFIFAIFYFICTKRRLQETSA